MITETTLHFETTKYLNLFADKWSPALQIRTVLLSIQALLSAPNPDDPLANDVAETWKDNEIQAIETGIHFFILVSILYYTFDRRIPLQIILPGESKKAPGV